MIFRALACDYDGTLASHDRIGPEAISALEQAREAGLRLILVTGRTFFDLTRACERLDLFHAVVAENGAVVYVPAAGMLRDQAPPPPPRLLAELDRRGIPFEFGRVIVGVARADEAGVRAALEAAGVRLQLTYNRGALMLLPVGVSKGKGVQQVIRGFGLSFHDVLALGDAENDLDLFDACGWTACPANAVPELEARADWTFPGEDGRAIADAILGPVLGGLLVTDGSPRQRLPLGWAVETAEPVSVPARGTNLLVHGDPLSGKSWLAGALVERLLGRRYAVCVLDPEGDYQVLARLPGVTWVEIRGEASMEQTLTYFERDPAACVVADLSDLDHTEKLRSIERGLATMRELRRRLGLPHWIVLDEAHYVLHLEGVAEAALGLEDKGFCVATYRPSWLRDSVARAIDVFVLARTAVPDELAFLRTFLFEPGWNAEAVISALPDLPRGEFVVVQREPDGARSALTFVATPRETPHVRHLHKYADSRVPRDRQFVFRRADGEPVGTADSLNRFRHVVASLDEDTLAHHARRRDFSHWVRDVFSDPRLGAQLRKLEARWSRGEIQDLRDAIGRLIALRYGADA